MPRYDIDLVRSAAAGRWPELLAALGKIDSDLLDGQHHGCPKCGGHDRFRAIDTADGALLCNQCFSTKNGDGFAALQWLLGVDFKEALRLVADHLGIAPEKGRKQTDPAEHLEFLPWNPTIVGLWCLKKKPLKPAAVQAVGGRVARYRKQYTVIAIPVLGPSLTEAAPVGWVLYRADGGELPKFTGKGKPPEWVKVKLAAGSQPGVICTADAFSQATIWKTEGPTDLMALVAAELPGGQGAFTTANGAQEKPLDWIVKLCEGKAVHVVHDADQPGQQGATFVEGRDGSKRPGWCPSLATSASEVRNVTLPYQIERTHGKDLRDYLTGGGTLEHLHQRVSEAEVFASDAAAKATAIDEREDDPHRLAKINLAQYQGAHGGRLVFWRGEWLRYKSGAYQKIAREDLRSKVNAAIREELVACWKERQRTGQDADKPVRPVTSGLVTNVMEAMQSMVRISWNIDMQSCLDTRERPYYVSMQNGILDLDAVFTGKPADQCLLPHSDNWFSTVKLAYDFLPDATCPLWEEYLDKTFEGDSERIMLVQEWAGYLLTQGGNSEQKFLALEGEGGNGKTVFLAAMTAMIGMQNISVVPLEKFGGRFDLYNTVGKMANICGDVGEIDRVAEGHLKDFTGGGAMSFDRKGIEPIQCIPTAKLMMSWNTRPRFRDRSQGLWRRMLLVPFNRKVPSEEKIAGMADPDWWVRQGEASGILLWAIAGLHRLRRRGDFTEPAASREASEDYMREANPALEFFDDNLEESESSYIKADFLYRIYSHWCEKSGIKPLGNRQFGKEVRKKFSGMDRKRLTHDGRPWVYQGIKFSTDEIFSIETQHEEALF